MSDEVMRQIIRIAEDLGMSRTAVEDDCKWMHVRWMIRRDIEDVLKIESSCEDPWTEEELVSHLTVWLLSSITRLLAI